MSFDYREAVDLKSLARFSVTELRDHLRHAMAGGWRVLAFFGIPDVPQNFAELVPWLVTVLACLAIFWGALKLMFGIVRTMSRWR